jgi:GT2 family glycosyltransferase
MNKKVLLDIIIVNWNAGKQLHDCLESIVTAKQDNFELNKVVVVDNASSDGSDIDIEANDFNLPLKVIRNSENRGFAAACNQGAAGSDADYLLFLNPDTRLFTDSLSKPLAFMEQAESTNIGICGIKLIDESGNVTSCCSRFPSLKIIFGKVTGLSQILPNIFPSHLMLPQELFISSEVEQVIGAFFLVRRSVYIENNGFDERFFVYFEEVDFSLRAKQAGYSSYYYSEATAYHKGGGCSEQIKSTRLFYSLRSRLQYGLKHYSLLENVALIILTLIVEFVSRSFLSLKTKSYSQFLEVVDAYKKVFVYFLRGGLNENYR